jgi:hypothetical protein
MREGGTYDCSINMNESECAWEVREISMLSQVWQKKVTGTSVMCVWNDEQERVKQIKWPLVQLGAI